VSGGLYCYHVGAIEEEITKVEQEIHGLEQKIHPSIRAEESERVDAALQSKREKLELLCGAREIARKQSIPSINDILLGKTKLSPICKSPPGEKYDYSNSGYIILQKVIEIVTGNFSQAVRERVLSKLQMDESTFSPELAQTVHGNEEGSPLIGSWRINPMQAAGGLWSTAEDLSKMIVAIQKTLAKEGSPIEGLGYNLAQEMMKGSEQDKTYGFGVEIWRTKGGDLYFGHGGGVPGFRTLLIGNTKGDGAVISINSDREGEDIMPEILCSIATAYEWPDGTSLERCLLPGLIPEESSQLDPNTWEAWVNGVDGVGGRYVFRTEGQKPVEHNVVIKFDPKEKKVRAVVDG
jgi:hypothetical protein